jgi:hypothetical protein
LVVLAFVLRLYHFSQTSSPFLLHVFFR